MYRAPTPDDRDAFSFDALAVDRVVAGLDVGRPLTWAEACHVVGELRGMSALALASRLCWTPGQVQRFRARLADWRAEQLTGDPFTERLLPAAAALICAVRDDDADRVAAAFADAERLAGGPLVAARALAVVLAAACPDTVTLRQLLAWRTDDDDPSTRPSSVAEAVA